MGIKGHIIKDYFYNFENRNNNFTVDLSSEDITYHNKHTEKEWKPNDDKLNMWINNHWENNSSPLNRIYDYLINE